MVCEVSSYFVRDNLDLQKAIALSVDVYDESDSVSSPGHHKLSGKRKDGFVTVHRDGTRILIAFRGTESFTDWCINFLRYRTYFPQVPGTMVHAGVLRQYNELRKRIMDLVQGFLEEGRVTHVLVTGHSLGGALATLCAADIAYQYTLVSVVCYPLNSPRVGNKQFVNVIGRLFNLQVLRVNTYGDLVPCVPYCGFVHTVKYVRLPISYKKDRITFFHITKRHSVHTIQKVFLGL
jgi:hypothetical protein